MNILKIHKFIVLISLAMTLTGIFVFFGVMSGGNFGPLFRKANQLDFELLVVRRITSLFAWIAFSFFSMYMAATEVGKSQGKRFIRIIHPVIILSYVTSMFYAIFEFSIIFYENKMQRKIIRLLYLSDLGVILLGLIMYLMLVYWIPKVREK